MWREVSLWQHSLQTLSPWITESREEHFHIQSCTKSDSKSSRRGGREGQVRAQDEEWLNVLFLWLITLGGRSHSGTQSKAATQNKHSCHQKKNLSHQCSLTAVNMEGDEEREGRCRIWWNGKDRWEEFHPWCCGTAVNKGGRQEMRMTMGKGERQWQKCQLLRGTKVVKEK